MDKTAEHIILDGLNSEQKKAVKHLQGPLLIIAGAGSGKTKTLTHRIANLIQHGVAPHHILAVTFTNKAAEEMRARTRALLLKIDPRNKDLFTVSAPHIGTFHSIAARILRDEIEHLGFSKHFSIYDEKDQESLMKKVLEELEISKDQFKPSLMLNLISQAKNELLTPDAYAAKAETFLAEMVAKVYARYNEQLKEHNALDFDDLLTDLVLLLREQPKILEKYRKLFQYILVDEYQDTNLAQYTIVKLLAGDRQNICAVGDDMQAIYGWRGADFRNILNFEQDYPETTIILLEENYRSTKNILNAANSVIQKNKYKKEKRLWTQNPDGNPITLVETANEDAEARFIIDEIMRMAAELGRQNHKTGVAPLPYNWNNFAILYRTNAQSRAIEQALLERNIPYQIIGGLRFYERREIKDILSYLRVLVNPADSISLERIINVPRRSIGPKSLKKIVEAGGWSIPPESLRKLLSRKAAAAAIELREAMMRAQEALDNGKTPLNQIIATLLSAINYKEYLTANFPDADERWENVSELIGLASTYAGSSARQALEQMLEDLALYDDASAQDKVKQPQDQIVLMTMHNAKGLEFPFVFIAGCEEGLLPHARSIDNPLTIEEERRLFYVGMTRAKLALFLSFSRSRHMYGSLTFTAPSRFLRDIPADLAQYRAPENLSITDDDETIDWD